MANPEHFKIFKEGVSGWNQWRRENRHIRPDLSGASFYKRNLSEVDLQRANLFKAQMFGVNLSKANLCLADLSRAHLVNTNLQKTIFKQADMHGADLNTVNLTQADLSDTDLRMAAIRSGIAEECKFNNALFFGTTLSDIDLSSARNLDSISHEGPSSIGIDTIFKSKGQIPETFLIGCGVPEDFIKLIPSLTSQPFQFYSCFISYSSQDDDFAHRLHADLQVNKVRVWFAPEDLKIGDKILERLDQSIRIHDKLLLVISEQSINSDWVEDEVTTAFEEERTRKKTVLFPIRLDDAVMDTNKAWAAKVRQRHIGDFTDWKNHDSYKQNFDRLLRDLKASEE